MIKLLPVFMMLLSPPLCHAGSNSINGNTKGLIASAEAGDRVYQFELAKRYADGIGVERDYQKAIYWLEKSAQQGFTESQFYLGWLYLHGKGVPENRTEALHLLESAAEAGDAYSQYLTAQIYEKEVMDESPEAPFPDKAVKWYGVACNNHIFLACERTRVLKIKKD
ncbi:sel1 repeat family protein [Morganella morganii]|uniref:tetratricopeptide repeat protein n=1 Tax=Morganella morganii TaxID=582 RepID=UPI00339BD8BA